MKRKLKKENVTIGIRPDIYFYVKQIAEKEHRSFANFLECLMLNEIEKVKKAGIKLNEF